jgi:uncharacterized membrane protein (UPF0127 family)
MNGPTKHLLMITLLVSLILSQLIANPNTLAAGRYKKAKATSPLKLTPLPTSSKEPQLEPILPPFEAATPTLAPELNPLPDIQKKLVPAKHPETESSSILEPSSIELPTLPKPKKPETVLNPIKPSPVPAYPTLPKVNLLLNGENFSVEVAQKLEDQLRGLMFRESVPAKTGMMFLFTPPRAVNFWMKNCKVSLDMIFIRNSTVVNTAENATPCIKDPCPVYGSIYAVDTVVELPAGSVKQFTIQPGDKIVLTKTQSPTAYNTETGYKTESPTAHPVPEMQPEIPAPAKP